MWGRRWSTHGGISGIGIYIYRSEIGDLTLLYSYRLTYCTCNPQSGDDGHLGTISSTVEMWIQNRNYTNHGPSYTYIHVQMYIFKYSLANIHMSYKLKCIVKWVK